MASVLSSGTAPRFRFPIYYGWVQVVIAAMAMVATLPGIHQGMGLVTEQLLGDLKMDRVYFAQISLWATWIGAIFCIPVGKLIDKLGVRIVLTIVSATLGVTVIVMSRSTSAAAICITMILASGLGHSALSVISVALVGKWFVKRLTRAMGIYAALVVVGFMIAFGLLGYGVRAHGWRQTWNVLGYVILFGLAPLSALLVRSSPAAMNLPADGEKETETNPFGANLSTAFRTPVFWLFALAAAYFGVVSSGVSLFDQAILKECGFDAHVYHNVLVAQTFTALIASFIGGWLGTRVSLSRQTAIAMAALVTTLVLLPNLNSMTMVMTYAMAMGIAGGLVTVIFFSAWSHTFGRAHLGIIQGVAQAMCVITSAFGPLILAAVHKRTGSYAPALYGLAPIAGVLGIWAWFTIPRTRPVYGPLAVTAEVSA